MAIDPRVLALMQQQGFEPDPEDMQPVMPQGVALEPDYMQPPVDEPALQEPAPDDFFARIAMGSGAHPFNFRARPGKGLDAVLAMLSGFGNARAGQAAQRISQTEQRNQQARDAAKQLATHRWQTYAADRAAARANRIATMRQQAADQRSDQSGALTERRLEEIERHNRNMERLAAARGGIGPGGDVSGRAGDEVDAWADRVGRGEPLSSVVGQNGRLRTAVVQRLNERGSVVLPSSARKALAEIGQARVVLGKLKRLDSKIPRGRGVKRFGQGLRNVAGARLQSDPNAATYNRFREGLLSNISRSVAAERGVLTNQDTDRARKLTPGLVDSREVADLNWPELESQLDEMEQRIVGAYGGKVGQPQPRPSGAQVVKWGRDANGNPVPMP